MAWGNNQIEKQLNIIFEINLTWKQQLLENTASRPTCQTILGREITSLLLSGSTPTALYKQHKCDTLKGEKSFITLSKKENKQFI